ncbi:MAG: lipopolysaccharide cholinephosphotransferase [Firmicutes bacterium]|nr:lipopolysaccharide cholinephosphotransferase [Bacillota bacterium]
MTKQVIKDVQTKILEIMVFIDAACREHGIIYYIMGGTALGAVRHGGFIPWDDDLDIFMTPENYEKFKVVFNRLNSEKFVLQEWTITEDYLEYAKVRMNGTTFIEDAYRNLRNMHHGIYVDIMILHKCPINRFLQKVMYYESKYVTLVALSQRNWKPKTLLQKIAVKIITYLSNKHISNKIYQQIFKYNGLMNDFVYCYFITKANFIQGVFDSSIFAEPVDIVFEDTILMGPTEIKKYLRLRYGNYMKLPSVEQRKAAIHAEIFDTEVGYEEYFKADRMVVI